MKPFLLFPLFTFALFRSEPVPVQTIATTKDGCHAFLDTMETITRERTGVTGRPAA